MALSCNWSSSTCFSTVSQLLPYPHGHPHAHYTDSDAGGRSIFRTLTNRSQSFIYLFSHLPCCLFLLLFFPVALVANKQSRTWKLMLLYRIIMCKNWL